MATALTGATGFLGLHLVRELLDRDGSLILLTHAGSAAPVDRVRRFLAQWGAAPDLLADVPRRVSAVAVDIAQPRLGLADREFRALADSIDVLWHSAALTQLGGEPAQLHRVNAEGTGNVLELAAVSARRPSVHHVSTAFVAGARRDPLVYEDDLDPSQGFESPYERSKYEAEVIVREWSAARSWPVVVFRPSVLVTDRPPHPDLPSHTLEAFARWVLTIASLAAEAGLGGGDAGLGGGSDLSRPTVRLVGDPRARWNLMPVEDAARDMARIADRPPPDGVTTYHIVQDDDLPASLFVDLLEYFFPVRLELVARPPADPSRLERMIDAVPGFTAYLRHQHVFDDTRTRTVLGERQAGSRVDREYLLSCFGSRDAAGRTTPASSLTGAGPGQGSPADLLARTMPARTMSAQAGAARAMPVPVTARAGPVSRIRS